MVRTLFGSLRQKIGTPLLVGLLLALFYAPLFDSRAVLATRDMVEYHLPMRAAFAALAGHGLPQWDPLAHGGQPLLSNPNYGAFYPPSWLALPLSPAQGVNLLVLLHAALAAWGAYAWARSLGALAGAARLAAVAFACGPTFLALLHTLTLALALAYLPWLMHFALRVLDRPADRTARRESLGCALSFAAIFLLGDPLIVALTLLSLVSFVAGRARERVPRLPRLAGPFAFGFGLAAVQVVPALARLADSPRAAGLDWKEATVWSLPWGRAAELVFPRFFGDDSQPELALYFGWGIHDRDYPYLLWIAVGLPLLLAGVASWARRGTPERWSWIAMAAAGLFLAFGRHNPLYRWAWTHLPGVDKLRFPEKFLLLGLTAAIFAGAVAWQRLLDARPPAGSQGASRPAVAGLATALAAVLTALALGLALVAFLAPQVVAEFAAAHSGLPLVGEALARAVRFYRHEALLSLGFAAATLVLFALAVRSRAPRRALEGAALALVTLELWTYGHGLVRTVPAEALFSPPQIARELPAGTERLFSAEPYRTQETTLVVAVGDPRLRWARSPIERLASRAGNLFGLAYVLDRDFDRSLTRPAARALRFYERVHADRELEGRLLGAWSASQIVERKPTELYVEEVRRAGPERAAAVAPVRAQPVGELLPRFRFVAGAELFPDAPAAERAAEAARLPFRTVEYLVDGLPEAQAAPPDPALRALLSGRLDEARVRAVEDRGDHVRLSYTAARPALLVAASTFDRRWRAHSGLLALPIFETAAGYMAIVVPPGEGEVELQFRDPWVGLGATISAIALLVALGVEARRRRLARSVAVVPT